MARNDFRFTKITDGMYEVVDKRDGETMGEVYQNGACWQVRDAAQPEGAWIAHCYITGLTTTYAKRDDAGHAMLKASDSWNPRFLETTHNTSPDETVLVKKAKAKKARGY